MAPKRGGAGPGDTPSGTGSSRNSGRRPRKRASALSTPAEPSSFSNASQASKRTASERSPDPRNSSETAPPGAKRSKTFFSTESYKPTVYDEIELDEFARMANFHLEDQYKKKGKSAATEDDPSTTGAPVDEERSTRQIGFHIMAQYKDHAILERVVHHLNITYEKFRKYEEQWEDAPEKSEEEKAVKKKLNHCKRKYRQLLRERLEEAEKCFGKDTEGVYAHSEGSSALLDGIRDIIKEAIAHLAEEKGGQSITHRFKKLRQVWQSMHNKDGKLRSSDKSLKDKLRNFTSKHKDMMEAIRNNRPPVTPLGHIPRIRDILLDIYKKDLYCLQSASAATTLLALGDATHSNAFSEALVKVEKLKHRITILETQRNFIGETDEN